MKNKIMKSWLMETKRHGIKKLKEYYGNNPADLPDYSQLEEDAYELFHDIVTDFYPEGFVEKYARQLGVKDEKQAKAMMAVFNNLQKQVEEMGKTVELYYRGDAIMVQYEDLEGEDVKQLADLIADIVSDELLESEY